MTTCPVCNERPATTGNDRIRMCEVCWPAALEVANQKLRLVIEALRVAAQDEERRETA